MADNVRIEDYIVDALTSYGKGVNTERQLAYSLDGLKPVYRRTIYTALKLAGNGMSKTATIVGSVMGSLHPHSDSSISDVVSSLVRWGIFDGQGNHGMRLIYGDDIEPSSSRYTEAKLSDRWRNIFKDLIEFVPFKEAEISGYNEPVYLPTPLPLILLFNGLGIGYGVNSRYPMFTPKSLYNAYLKDDPYELEAPEKLSINYSKSELDDLWEKGLGKVCYEYSVTPETISAGKGVMIEGSAEIFKPNLDKGFFEELQKGQVFILDRTDSEIPKVFVGKSPNVKAISLEDIYDTCKILTSYQRTFRLTVSDGDHVFVIPLREWIRTTMENYIGLVEEYKLSRIKSLEFDHEVYAWLPIITQCLIDHRDYDAEKLASINKCDLDIVKAIMRKTINTLRNTDSTAKMASIREEIKKFKALSPTEFVNNLIVNEF